MIRTLRNLLRSLGNGNCPRCGGPLTAAGNCANLCGGV